MHIKQAHVVVLIVVISFQQASGTHPFGYQFFGQDKAKYREHIELRDAAKQKQTPRSPEPKQEHERVDLIDRVISAFLLSGTPVVQDDEIYQYPVCALPFP